MPEHRRSSSSSRRSRRRTIERSAVPNPNPDPRALQVVAAIAITVMCWSFGGVQYWARFAFAGVCVAVFFAALWPDPRAFMKRTVRTGFFWGGLFVTLYTLIQALNPSYDAIVAQDLSRRIEARPHIEWLPTGVNASWYQGSPWRNLAMISATWLAFVGLRGGLQDRRSWIRLVWIAVLNGSAVAFVGSLVELTGSKKILWVFDSINRSFFGTFYYKNHAAAFHYLTIALCGVLYFYHLRQTRVRGLKSGPHLICPLLALLNFAAVYQTDSKGGMLLAGAVTVIVLVTAFGQGWQHWRASGEGLAGLAVPGVFGLILLIGGAFTLPTLVDFEKNETLISGLFDDMDSLQDAEIEQSRSSNRHRFIMMRAFGEMLMETPFWGVGAGCFEHFSREYSIRYPDIYYARYDRKAGGWVTYIWVDAHSDWIEFAIEYGWGAFALVLFTLGCCIWEPLRNLSDFRLSWVPAAAGAGAFAFHAVWEFVFQAPTLVFFFTLVLSTPLFLRRRVRA